MLENNLKPKINALIDNLNKLSKQYQFDVDDVEYKDNALQFVLDSDSYAAVDCAIFDFDASSDDLRLAIMSNIMVSSRAKHYLTDDALQKMLSSRTRFDNDIAYLQIEHIFSAISAHHDLAYNLARDASIHQLPLKTGLIDNDPYEQLLSSLFAKWCKKAWLDGEDFHDLEYPARASLNYDAVRAFAFYAVDQSYFAEDANIDVYDLQVKIMRAFGISTK